MTVGDLKKILADIRDDMPVAICEEYEELAWRRVINIGTTKLEWIRNGYTMNINNRGGGSGGMPQRIPWTEADGATEYLLITYTSDEEDE